MIEPQETNGIAAGDEEVAPRIGVYVCHCGGNISDVVDVEAVVRHAEGLDGVVVARDYPFMCSDPGQNLIVEDIEKHGLNRVVVASCSPSLHETTFRQTVVRGGLNPFLYEHVNVREQVSWVHGSAEQATTKSSTLVSAAVARVRKHEALSPIRVGARSKVLVVGGGVAGLKAALDLAEWGFPVALVEMSARLGGHVNDLGTLFPTGESGPELVRTFVDRVTAHPGIEVLTETRVTGASGYVGNFDVQAEKVNEEDASPFEIQVGAVVLASGFRHYEPAKREYGYKKFPSVVTLPDFLATLDRAEAGDGRLRIDDEEVRRVAFIHCVGSRQVPGLHKPDSEGRLNENCSRVCCTATLKAEADLLDRFPGTAVYDFYRDIRTYGHGHEEYYENASKKGVIFLRFEPETPPAVKKAKSGDEGRLLVTVKDGLTWGEEVEVPVDLVVLATGMVPADPGPIATSLKIASGSDGFLQEVHPKLRPVEVAVRGVVLAGTCQSPRDVEETCASASAAAVKVAGLLNSGELELDPYVARVNKDRCDGTGACLAECEYDGALEIVSAEIDGKTVRKAVVHEAFCTGCGACVAACPNRAIDVNGWTLDQFGAMVDEILAVPEEVSK
ncbi:MAG: CoB--CoM heterodisulfide reductase iron-sulfur subunit A family protein [Planctomycetota bacterium]